MARRELTMEGFFRLRMFILFIMFCGLIFFTNVWIKKEIDGTMDPINNLEIKSQPIVPQQEEVRVFSGATEKIEPLEPTKEIGKQELGATNEDKYFNDRVIHEPALQNDILVQ